MHGMRLAKPLALLALKALEALDVVEAKWGRPHQPRPFSIPAGNAMSDGITITPNTQAQKVREELFRITGQEGWNRDEYWKYYLVIPSSLWQAAV
jgi:hypothetical protein